VALNIDKAIVSAISETGSADILSEKQRLDLPQERDLSLPGYRERLTTIYDFHPPNRHDKGNVHTFIQAQAVWDEAMAENIVEFIRKNPNTQLLVLAGAQHVRKDSGIPPRVQRRYTVEQKVVLTRDHFSASEETVADFFFSSDAAPLPPAGRIGISLEEKTKNDDTYLEITGLVKESKAFTSGLKAGDRIVSINGDNIQTLSDIRIALLGATPGEVVEIEVNRTTDQDQTSRHHYRIELSPPLNPHR
jgi:C-terminal processing protease CtpA/Prc